MPWVGVLPALSVFYVRKFVNEPPLWVENRRKQRSENREARVPLISIFARGMLVNTLLACWWMASNFVLYYSLTSLFATHLQKDLGMSPALLAIPILFFNLVGFAAMSFAATFATDPLTVDEQSDRTGRLGDAINATLSASQAKVAPAVPKEFSVGVNTPLYYNSNAAGHASLDGNPERLAEPGGGQDLALRMCRSFELKFSL